MGKTIVFVSSVGGTGKTTVAATISHQLSKMGKSVLLIETDPFRPLGILLESGEEAVYDLHDLLCGACEVENAIVSVENGLDMIIGPAETLRDDSIKTLASFVNVVRNKYDFVVIDRPSEYDVTLESNLSDFIALVVHQNNDPLSLVAAEKMGEKLKSLSQCEGRIILNKFTYKKDKKVVTNLDEISDKTGLRILGVVPDDEDVISARKSGKLPSKGRSVDACCRISERLLNQPTPLPNLKKM